MTVLHFDWQYILILYGICFALFWFDHCRVIQGPLQLRTKHGGDNARSPWRNGFWAKYFYRFKRGCKMRPTCKIPAQLPNLAKSYGLPKLSTYTVIKLQFLGLQLSRQIKFVQIAWICLIAIKVGQITKSITEQYNLEQNLLNSLRIEDLKIVVGQLESQEMPVYYSVWSRLWEALSFY
jgi:hypothetical protein